LGTGVLTTGHTQSCGCLRKERQREAGKRNTIGFGKAAANSVLYGYKKAARIRNLEWSLTDEEFFNLTQKNCFYCNELPSLISRRSTSYNGSYTHNGIDRKDRLVGYIKDNVVPCCKRCNYAKHKMNLEEFKIHIKNIYINLYGI